MVTNLNLCVMACREEGCSLEDGRDVNNVVVVGEDSWVVAVVVVLIF